MSLRIKRRHNPTTLAKPLTPAQVERLLYGQSIPDKYQRERLEQARKELAMPDLQSELKKAVSEWDNHEQEIRQQKPPQEKTMQPTTQVTKSGNMRRDLFAFIKDNAYKYTARHVTDKFEELGYNAGSAHTALVQMKRAGMVTADANSRLYTLTETYKTFNNPYVAVSRAKKKAVKATKTTKSAGIAALAGPVAAPAAVPAYKVEPMPTALTSEYVMARIGVAEAHKLYVELGKMFGGKS